MTKKLDNAVKGALIISIGGIITKLLGALYRIPLTNLLKAEGLGIYQTVFPVYCILLTFSSTGIPSAISKLVSSNIGDETTLLKKTLKLFVPLGLLGSILMLALSYPFSLLQGNENCYLSYVFLSPSVVFVSAISCFRGYFQGKRNMLPTAVSQITEQAVKLIVGITLLYLIKTKTYILSAIATLSVSISEFIALLYLYFLFKKENVKLKENTKKISYKTITKTIFPITLSAVLIPLSKVFDSFVAVNLMSFYTEKAVGLYGVYTGSIESVIGVPIAICYGLAISYLPEISALKSKKKNLETIYKTNDAISLTAVLSCVFAIGVFLFSKPAVKILFSGLDEFYTETAIKLLKIASVNVFLISVMQTMSSVLIAYGKSYLSCAFLGVGIALKCTLELIFLKNPNFNVYALLLSDILCYFVAVFLDLVYIIIISNSKKEIKDENNFNRNRNGDRRPYSKCLRED